MQVCTGASVQPHVAGALLRPSMAPYKAAYPQAARLLGGPHAPVPAAQHLLTETGAASAQYDWAVAETAYAAHGQATEMLPATALPKHLPSAAAQRSCLQHSKHQL